jgi:hypothetical protein
MRRLSAFVLAGMLASGLLASASVLTAAPVSAAPIAGAPVTYCADPDTDPSMDTGDGTMITCDTTITNTITAIDSGTGVASGSSVIVVTECRGFSIGRLDPTSLTCTTDTQNLVNLVASVDQCNEVGYGGGNVLECTVNVINYYVGVVPQAIGAATVNQCNGSATDTTGCTPFPASTTNATITQCNDSSYGGGQEDFICTASGTTSATLDVTVNQCNNSNYGGGSWLTCTTSLSSVIGGPTPSALPHGALPSGGAPSPTGNSAPASTAAPSSSVAPAPISTTAPATPAISAPAVPVGETTVVAPVPTLPATNSGTLGVTGVPSGAMVLVVLLAIGAASLAAVSRRFDRRQAG